MSQRLTRLKKEELLAKPRKFGVEVMPHRGKGSHIIFQKPTEAGSKGPQHSLKDHGKNAELGVGTIKAILGNYVFNLTKPLYTAVATVSFSIYL